MNPFLISLLRKCCWNILWEVSSLSNPKSNQSSFVGLMKRLPVRGWNLVWTLPFAFYCYCWMVIKSNGLIELCFYHRPEKRLPSKDNWIRLYLLQGRPQAPPSFTHSEFLILSYRQLFKLNGPDLTDLSLDIKEPILGTVWDISLI